VFFQAVVHQRFWQFFAVFFWNLFVVFIVDRDCFFFFCLFVCFAAISPSFQRNKENTKKTYQILTSVVKLAFERGK